MATLVQELHVQDEQDPKWRLVAEVSPEGAITFEIVADGDSIAFLNFTPADSTALVEFLGPKVKQVR